VTNYGIVDIGLKSQCDRGFTLNVETHFALPRYFCVSQCELWDFSANILPSNFYNAKTISGVAKCQSFSDENLFVDAVAKGTFMGMSYPKISGQFQLRFLLMSIDTEKLINAEGLFLVKLREGIDSDSKVLLCLLGASRL
jgi:hypothetical protein